MALVDDVRASLRITSEAFDGEINDLISACTHDLDVSGVISTPTDDPLIRRAITLYCKANFGLGNQDAEKYNASYENLKTRLAVSGNHKIIST